MRILYDYQILYLQRYGGISRYYYELITTINSLKKDKADIYCFLNPNYYFEEYFNNHSNPLYEKVKGRRFINRLITRIKLTSGRYDIFHPTYYDSYFLDYYDGKIVVTVYDMIHEMLPEFFANDKTTVEAKKKLIYAADKIIAISNSTKNDILKMYPDIPEDKISVIYISSAFEYKKGITSQNFPNRYILFVGNRIMYKNYERFFDAIKPILESDGTLSLVCLGGGKFTEKELENQKQFGDRIIQLDVTDELLSYAYSHAECFVFPSLYEGFGIPTLEAFACNCPVVLSNTSSLPEVGGDAAEYFNPYNIDEITSAISKVIYDDNLRSDMILKGQKQLKNFDWNDIAKRTLACYEEVLNK